MPMDTGKNLERDWTLQTALAITIWLILSILVSLANPIFARSVWPVLFIVFVLAYVYLAVCHFMRGAKAWSEHYLDTLLTQHAREKERNAREIGSMVERVEEMEKKADSIEAMLAKISE